MEGSKVEFESQIVSEKEEIAREKEKYKNLWSKYCARCSCDNETITSLEMEIEELWMRLSEAECLALLQLLLWLQLICIGRKLLVSYTLPET